MNEPALQRLSPAEYIAFEVAQELKHEYLAGAVYAMAGGTPEHAALAVRVSAALLSGVSERPCAVYSSDLKLYIEALDVFTYPDVAVICGEPQLSDVSPLAVTNPSVLVEVTSPSSAAYDRGEKFDFYRALPSLKAYLLVAHDRERLDLYERDEHGAWHYQPASAGESVTIAALGVSLPVDAVYRGANGRSLARPEKRVDGALGA